MHHRIQAVIMRGMGEACQFEQEILRPRKRAGHRKADFTGWNVPAVPWRPMRASSNDKKEYEQAHAWLAEYGQWHACMALVLADEMGAQPLVAWREGAEACQLLMQQ